jgi:transposase-like protein
MRHRSERVRALITDDVIPRTPSGGVALCHHHQRMVMHYDGLLNYLVRRVTMEAVGMDWAHSIVPLCPRCGCSDHYEVQSRKSFKCKKCKADFRMNKGRYRCNKLPLEKLQDIAAALKAGESGLSVSKRFEVQTRTVYKIRDRARD